MGVSTPKGVWGHGLERDGRDLKGGSLMSRQPAGFKKAARGGLVLCFM